MKYTYFICFLSINLLSFGQNIQVDSQTYSPQQLIENILIDSNCITNVMVTNVIGGDFSGTDQSYGYFDSTGTSFPFQRGIVLSTGKLLNVEGPNDRLSDDDAPGWIGDSDLENILNEPNTINATIIEFDFTAIASQISFRYLFASEEYREGNPSTCQYSDLFGFLIRNVNATQYTNIALIPNTQTPVKVTTVHPNIPGGCAAQNETYFRSWNNSTAPINFNGQTTVLTATANTIPNETYHVKLVIADEQNYRYDSAVFLEAGSFQLSTELGEDRLIATNNPICANETFQLNANQAGNNTYKWFKDGVEILNETNDTFAVSIPGIYTVEVTLQNNCIAYGEIKIEYSPNPILNNTTLITCDENQDGFTTYNLFDSVQNITNNDQYLSAENFFYLDSLLNIVEIDSPESFENTTVSQIVFAKIMNQFGCSSIAEVTLDISNNSLIIPPFETCDDDNDGYTTFNLNELKSSIEPIAPVNASITFYKTLDDFFAESNALGESYINDKPYLEMIYVKVKNGVDCYALSTVDLVVLDSPLFSNNQELYYCLNTFPSKISIDSGLLNGYGNNPIYQWFLNNISRPENTSNIEINETGTYSVVVSFSNGCSRTRDVFVNASELATITQNVISIIDISDNNSLTINDSGLGLGDYEYALEDASSTLLDEGFFNYQDDLVFNHLKGGLYKLYVRDKNGCGTTFLEISIIGYPKFFTPNGDGNNDFWQIRGVSSQFQPNSNIYIFDRYGKLLKQLNPLGNGWDGTFNGKFLPNDDYWFKVLLEDGRDFMGHFTLKR